MGSPSKTALVVLALLVGLTGFVKGDSQTASKDTALMNLTLKDVTVNQAIDKIFEGRGLEYQVQPGITGKVVELIFKGITFEQALKAFTDAAGLTCRLVNGVYVIGPAGPSAAQRTDDQIQPRYEPSLQGSGPSPQPEADNRPPAVPANTGNSVMVESGPVFYGPPSGGGPGGYFYPPFPPMYQFGNVGIVSPFGPVVFGGGQAFNASYGPRDVYFPPPPDWVNPNYLQLLRNAWAFSPVRQYAPAYGFAY